MRLRGQLAFEEWKRQAHPPQLPPPDWRRTWYAQGARGSGKTRLGSETLGYYMQTLPPDAGGDPREFAAIGRTYADARDVMVEHRKSGLLRTLGGAVSTWNRSLGELRLTNGAWLFIAGAKEGAQKIQGKGLSMAWCDEIGLWEDTDAWEESLEFALRMDPALIIATGTPKGKKGVVKLLLEEPPDRIVFTFPKLAENADNLDASALEALHRKYDGTRMGRQELEGEILGDVPGALWTLDLIEETRTREARVHGLRYPEIHRERTVVAIDPATTANEETSDETGIVVVRLLEPDENTLAALGWRSGIGAHAVVLEDCSGIYTPTEWARAAVEAYDRWGADRIVAEVNQGGDMVGTIIRQIRQNIPYRAVTASKGKRTRAEPIAALYEQRRVHHVETLLDPDVPEDLETQMTSWVPGEDSPDRMDALVWAMTDLFIEDSGGDYAFAERDAGQFPEPITAGLLDRIM